MEQRSTNGSQGLGRHLRLKSRKKIQTLFREGFAFSSGPVRTVARLYTDESPRLQAGFTVGSRHFSRAVDRNRIKRLLKEAWRLQRAPLEEAVSMGTRSLDVFLIFSGRELPMYSDLSKRVKKAIERLSKTVADDK